MNFYRPGVYCTRRCGSDTKYCDGKCILCDAQSLSTTNSTRYVPPYSSLNYSSYQKNAGGNKK